MKLRALAPAKVNLCLFLGPLREDGRHELVTLFESVSLADEVLLETDADRDDVLCPGVPEPNLVSRAIESLRAAGWGAPPVRVEIVKRVPVSGGMGGGSADAAAMLRMAAQLGCGRSLDLLGLAASLGSDVPSQLEPGVVLGVGAGEDVESFAPQPAHAFVIVPQRTALLTADVYAEADRLGLPRRADDLLQLGAELLLSLRGGVRPPDRLLVNELEPAAVSLCPALRGVLEAVSSSGPDRAMVCGSGPTVAGLFWGADALTRAERAAALLGQRYPGTLAVEPVGAEFALPRYA